MPKPRAAKLETSTARRKLAVRKKPYWTTISPGIHLGYRRNQGSGTWSVRVADSGAEWIKKIALADDLEVASPPHVLSYWQALDTARALARRQPGEAVDESRPLTVGEALDRYEADLRARGGSPYNAQHPRIHLPGVDLEQAGRAVGRYRASEVARQPLGQGARARHRQQDEDWPAGGTGTRGGARSAHRKRAGLENWPRRFAG
jgi:hypothetical protein